MTQLFTRMSLNDPTQREVVAQVPWHVQLWSVDVDCSSYDPSPTTVSDQPTSVHVPPHVPEESIATMRQFSPEANALLTDLTEARPLIRAELAVTSHSAGQQFSGLVDCAATLDFVFRCDS
jgi:hypothetical protein